MANRTGAMEGQQNEVSLEPRDAKKISTVSCATALYPRSDFEQSVTFQLIRRFSYNQSIWAAKRQVSKIDNQI